MERIPFNKEEELKVTGEYHCPGFGFGPPIIPRRNMPMTPREHYLRMMKGEKPLWMPTGYDFVSILPRIIPDNVARAFVMEAEVYPRDKVGGLDFFGVEWEFIPQAGGSMVRGGNPKIPDICEWENYITFPDLKALDWEGSAEANKALLEGERVVETTIMNGLFERLISFMDFSEAAIALIDEDEKEGVHRLFSRLCDFYEEEISLFKKYYNIDQVVFHDDWGSQRAPFFSADTCREMLVPYLKRLVDHAHSLGIIFELHSCGKNEPLVPCMIEAGVDVWKPQPMNDFDLLDREYGDKIVIGRNPPSFNAYKRPTEPEELVALAMEQIELCRGKSGMCCGLYLSPEFADTIYALTREEYMNL